MFGFFHFQNLVGIAATIFCNQTLIKKSLNVFFFQLPGTTWTQEMVWMILHNCERAKSDLNDRSPFIEYVSHGF